MYYFLTFTSFEIKIIVEAKIYYENRVEELNGTLKKVQKKYLFFTFLRLLFFVIICISLYSFWGSITLLPAFILSVAFFLYVVHLSVDAKYDRDKVVVLITINKNELEVLNGNWLMFEDGSEFRDGQHPFSLDMDLFGKKSVFQLLNRTVSVPGKSKLANTLANGTSRIKETNACILELSEKMTWCQEFIAEGIVHKEEAEKQGSLNSLSSLTIDLKTFVKILRFLLPSIAIISTILFAVDIIPTSVFSFIIVVVMLPIGQNVKNANAVSQVLNIHVNRVKTILKQLELFSSLSIQNQVFKMEQDQLLSSSNSVLNEMKDLDKIIGRFDVRKNLLIGTLFNFFFAWDFQILYQMKNWLDKNRTQLSVWEDKMAELEVWISGAVYKFNNPTSIFSEMNSEIEEIEIIGLSHPFVDQKKSVPNDVFLNDKENFIIITGPNMAGKSTYLRSLGLTFAFSNAGFPILANSCKIPKLKLYSSMRTSDDLTVESSYFHAELVRLRFIMDAIEKGEKVFIILDEILKGTNSKDKEIGSARFLQKLKRLNARGIIATHDLSLCELSFNNDSFKNMCFDSIIEGENLSFDYRINEGVCKNMNASFLLKQMKLVDDL